MILFTIDCNNGVCRFIMEQQALDSNRCIVYRFIRVCPNLIALFTAVSIYAVSNAINEIILFTFHSDLR